MTILARAAANPVLMAVADLIEANVTVGVNPIQAGRGEAPPCEPPYVVVEQGPGSTFDGDLSNPEVDYMQVIQVSAVSPNSQVADQIRDDVRQVMKPDDLNAAIGNLGAGVKYKDRRVIHVSIAVDRAAFPAQRGLPQAIFASIDQYEVYHVRKPVP